MGVFGVSSSTSYSSFSFLLLIYVSLVIPLYAENGTGGTTTPGDIAAATSSGSGTTMSTNPLPSPPTPEERPDFSPFKPRIAVVVGVLTTMFSITFLLLLYAKHCKRATENVYGQSYHDSRGGGRGGGSGATGRKNSGIDRVVIESLPIFRFESLWGQKEGLECAVCLSRFEPVEVLRLLPKCKHAFHVECVDTWLDAHSTCPLCRYRVDPEDILLIEDCNFLHGNPQPQQEDPGCHVGSRRSRAESTRDESTSGFRRVSGRHSSAGERTSKGFLQIVLQKPGEAGTSSREPASFRRSLDSSSSNPRKRSESVAVGCFDRPVRKDGLLLTDALTADRKSFERRFEHRIIVSVGNGSGGLHHQQRWSDVQPSDLLYLRSEMIISESHRLSLESRPSLKKQKQQQQQQPQLQLPLYSHSEEQQQRESIDGSGRSVINSRSVSEITGLSRLSSRASNNSHYHDRQRQAGVVSRWLAWVSSQSLPDVPTHCTTAPPPLSA